MADKTFSDGELRHIADQIIPHRKRTLGTAKTDEEFEHEVYRTLESLGLANRAARLFERGGLESLASPLIHAAEPTRIIPKMTLCQEVALLLRNCIADVHPDDIDHVEDFERVNFAPALQAAELVEWAAAAQADNSKG